MSPTHFNNNTFQNSLHKCQTLFLNVFLDRKHSKTPPPLLLRKDLWEGLFKSPRHSFFSNLPFQNLRLKVVPLAERGADTVSILLIYARIMKKCLSNFTYDNLRSFIIVNMVKNPFFLQVHKIERINRD